MALPQHLAQRLELRLESVELGVAVRLGRVRVRVRFRVRLGIGFVLGLSSVSRLACSLAARTMFCSEGLPDSSCACSEAISAPGEGEGEGEGEGYRVRVRVGLQG